MSDITNNNPTIPSQIVAKVTFPQFINQLGIIPTSYKDSMDYYQNLAWLCKYLEETVIPTVNQNGEAVEELQGLYVELKDYVDNYFDNLDVQEEINNKLDEMTQDGTLTNLIKNYVDPIYEAYESEINEEITTFKNTVNSRLSEQDSEIQAISSGAPIPVSSTSDMTDTTKIYLNTTNGYWYFYDGDSWEQGGIYQASINPIYDDFISIVDYYPINITGYIKTDGTFNDSVTTFRCTDYIPVITNKIKIEGTFSNLSSGNYVSYYNKDKQFISAPSIDTSLTTHELTIPEYVKYIRICVHYTHNDMTYEYYRQTINYDTLLYSKFNYLSDDFPLNITGYIDNDGNLNSSITSFRCTDYIPCIYDKIKTVGSFFNLSNNHYVNYYDINKNYIESATFEDTIEKTFTIPSNCYYIRFCCPYSRLFTYSFYSNSLNINKLLYLIDMNKIDYQGFAGFKKFGVVGDSLSVGYMQDSDHTEYGRNIYYSWPQYLARYLHNTALNFGFSGAKTSTWYTNASHGYVELIESDNLCQAYIVGIGTNDNAYNEETTGSISDIDWSDRDNNADTFYGNYAKILQAINDVAPNSKIFVLTIPYPRSSVWKNPAIREIANNEHLSNITLVDLDQYYNEYFKSNNINGFAYANHFTAQGYSNIAKLMNFILNNEMVKNASDFIDIFKIPYGNNDIIN